MRQILLVLTVFAMGVMAVLLVATFNPTSMAQNTNSPTTTNRNDSRSITQQPSGGGARPQEDFSKNTWELPEDADKTKNPVAVSAESIAKGKELYLARKGNCAFCHGQDGTGNAESLPRLRRKPADISNKERMTSMTDGEVFWKISKGIKGIMPAGDEKMTEEERWHVVNYVRTLVKAE
ncbi:MAG TPA: cytochrome c [Pyrinomonadaceae bacterium]|nr:cytochrome c [Pyrinomonadaceae bacterium]